MSQNQSLPIPVRPVVVCEPGRVVVKLNRAAPPPERLTLLGVIGVASAAALGLLLWLAPFSIHPAAVALFWLALLVISLYLVSVEATLIATSGTGAYVEHRGPLGTRRSQLLAPGEARSIGIREKVDFESDLRPFSGYEVVADTHRGQVILCTAGARQQAVDLARSLARALDCEARVA